MATIEERVSYVEGRMDSLATKEDLADLKGELKGEMATMRGDVMAVIAKAEVRITRWTIGTLIASLAVIAAIAIAI